MLNEINGLRRFFPFLQQTGNSSSCNIVCFMAVGGAARIRRGAGVCRLNGRNAPAVPFAP
jgi:hypothetical protein